MAGAKASQAFLFQSTPPCGGDKPPPWAPLLPPNFNPRPLAGATHSDRLTIRTLCISIHAPLRGRQVCGHVTARDPEKFQSTPPCGGDPGRHLVVIQHRRFQSTPPCGGDDFLHLPMGSPPHFNPRPLAGATFRHPDRCSHLAGFQSTPPCGGDRPCGSPDARELYFNPRPLAGATLMRLSRVSKSLFQSTPPCGGDSYGPLSFTG